MALGKGLNGFRVLAIGLLVAAPATAFAHAHLTSPPSRAGTNDTTIKIGPCGNLPRGSSFVQLDAGSTIKVDYMETVAHQGCYQFRLGDKNDSNFKLLKQVNDPSGDQGAQSTMVQLPAGFTCESCTLQMLQLMNGANPCAADADPATASQGVYYSCADIRVGDFPDAAPSTDSGTPVDEDGGGTSSSGGSTTEPTDGGGKTSSSSGNGATGGRSLRQSDDGGCNVADGTTTGLSFFLTTGLAVLAIARRRRKS